MSAEKLQPGQRVFIDHFDCSNRGRKCEGQGIQNKQKNAKVSNPAKLFKGGCIFVDAATGYIDVQSQIFFSASATINAMEQFKANA